MPIDVVGLFFLFIFTLQAHGDNSGLEPIEILRSPVKANDLEKAKLGQILFSDVRLSKNNTISCASCHNLDAGGVDRKSKSTGINGALGGINAPTVFNSGLNFVQFWNGRAKSLEDQIDGPIQHPKEMGADWNDVIAKLRADKTFSERFQKIYPAGISRDTVKNAIATFERHLTTPNSRFDKFLAGDKTALTTSEHEGYQKFKSFGCIACHQGMNVGGNMFQTMGIMGNYFKDRGTPLTEDDYGRFTVTHQESDRHVFRVPSLRNIELTAPYFHDGSAPDLEAAVVVMAKYQLGRKLSVEDKKRIVDFLKTLTGEKPQILQRQPASQAGP